LSIIVCLYVLFLLTIVFFAFLWFKLLVIPFLSSFYSEQMTMTDILNDNSSHCHKCTSQTLLIRRVWRCPKGNHNSLLLVKTIYSCLMNIHELIHCSVICCNLLCDVRHNDDSICKNTSSIFYYLVDYNPHHLGNKILDTK
jgi:hypothetical protein